MAYSSFSKTDTKYGFLCYPSDKVEIKKISYKNNINQSTNNIFICGIPLKKGAILDAKKIIMSELHKIDESNIVTNEN
ncbi:hypothetical protein D3C84_435760 [compost metagenome]